MYPDNQKIKKILSHKLFTVIIIAVIFLIGLSFYKDYEQQQDIKQEIKSLESEITVLHGKKIELAKLIDILKSSNYIEKEARMRLGLKKEGEQVISVPDNARPERQVKGVSSELLPERPNVMKWFDFFFSPPHQ